MTFPSTSLRSSLPGSCSASLGWRRLLPFANVWKRTVTPALDRCKVGDPRCGTVVSAYTFMRGQALARSRAAVYAAGAPAEFYNRIARAGRPDRHTSARGEVSNMVAESLRPTIVKVMAENRERPLKTQEIYDLVAEKGVPGFDPKANRDRNLVNRELSDLAGKSPDSHSKSTPQLLNRVGPRPVYIQGTGPSHGHRPGPGVPGAYRGVREAPTAPS